MVSKKQREQKDKSSMKDTNNERDTENAEENMKDVERMRDVREKEGIPKEKRLMADDAMRQRSISASLDPPHQCNKPSNINKRRFRRCKSAPSIDLLLDPAKPGGLFPVSHVIFKNLKPGFRQITTLVIIYFVVGTGGFCLMNNQIEGKKTNQVI